MEIQYLVLYLHADNEMKGNSEECYLIISTNESLNTQLGGSFSVRTNYKKFFGVRIDYKLNFDEHVQAFSIKAHIKLRALAK